MTRHGKNNTASAVYSYKERERDAKSSGYGTQRSRLGADAQKDFDACSLTLQPCRNPVVTPEGHLYDKEAILEYILNQRVMIRRRMKEYEKAKKKEEEERKMLEEAAKREAEEKFMKTQTVFASSSSSSRPVGQNITISNMGTGNDSKLPSFWVPSMTPQSAASKIEKPDETIYCPMSEKPLRAKDLIPVKFTLLDPNDELGSPKLLAKKERYKCAVTGDVLSNSTPCAVLKTSGHVVTWDCVEKLIKKEMMDPTTGEKLKESDIIKLQMGGTGFAATNNVVAEVKKPVMMA